MKNNSCMWPRPIKPNGTAVVVERWDGYGIVAPDFVTTNGSLHFLKQCLPAFSAQLDEFYDYVIKFGQAV